MKTYSIVRFYMDSGKLSEVVNTGFTLEQAQRHCSDKKTRGDGWFDGYTEEVNEDTDEETE